MTLVVALRATPARLWTMHKKNITTWETRHRLLAVRFGIDAGGMSYWYDGHTNPIIHMEACVQAWQHRNANEWVHLFVHTLDTTPMNWYTKIELRRGTKSWSLLTEVFHLTFGFELEYPKIEDALGVIRMKLFDVCPLLIVNQLDWAVQMEHGMECYNFAADEEEDPRNVNIPKLEGSCNVQGLALEIPEITEKVKIKKVSIGTEVDPKFASIGDNWNDETVGHIVDLLQEYQDMFPTKFVEMKGILGDLGVMRIPLKAYTKPMKQRLYRLNPRYKEKVIQELDKMIIVGIIEPVEESEWVRPMVV